MSDQYTTFRLASLWGVSERTARYILGQLEGLGLRLDKGQHGERYLPPEIAEAVLELRQAGKPLEELLNDPRVGSHLPAPQTVGQKPDLLHLIMDLRGQISITRSLVAAMVERVGALPPEGASSWDRLGLPNPLGWEY